MAGAYEWITYREVGEARTAIGSGLMHLGVPSSSGVGIYSVNCVGEFERGRINQFSYLLSVFNTSGT